MPSTPTIRLLLTGIAALGVAAPTLVASTAVAEGDADAVGTSELRGPVAAAVIEAVGFTDTVAERSGIEPEALLDVLRTDENAFVDGAGGLGFTEPVLGEHDDHDVMPGPAVAADATPAFTPTTIATTGATSPPAGATAVPALHSRLGADRVIYLDTDGHTTTDTAWNAAYTNGAPIESGPYDIDGNPTALSSAEAAAIEAIWARVAEDFAPFDVDVTTEEPAPDRLVRSGPTDANYGVRVVVTNGDWYLAAMRQRIGGIAYLGSVEWSSDTPAFVFTGNLGGVASFIGEAASHEVGHTVGLSHDGTTGGTPGDDYYGGHGVWAPIMGVGYYRLITQWSRGEYAGANNDEDDLATIAEHLGVTPDDHADVAPGTTVAAGAAVTGIIAPHDVDVFTLVGMPGPTNVVVTPTSDATDLAPSVTVTDSHGQQVARSTGTPESGWATIAAIPTAGDFTVAVTSGNYLTLATGFSAYASLGAYELRVVAGAIPPTAVIDGGPVAGNAPLAIRFDGSASSDPSGGPLGYQWRVDGYPVFSNSPTLAGSIPSAGTHQISLTVTDSSGLFATASTTVVATTTPTTTPTTTTPTTTTPTLPPTTTPPPDPATPPPAPSRLLDTRSGDGGATRLQAGQTIRLAVAGRGQVPVGIDAAVLNITAVNPAASGFVTTYPCDGERPTTSTLNFASGTTVANSTVASLATDGTVCLYSPAATDLVVDVTGWIDGASGGLGRLTPREPSRALDTRDASSGSTRLAAGQTITVDLSGFVAPAATAVAVNLTAVSPAAPGFLTAWPCGERPTTSSVNYLAGDIRPNNAIVGLGPADTLCIYSLASTDVLVDVTGSFSPTGELAYRAVVPHRVLDTRAAHSPVPERGEVSYTAGSPAGAHAIAASVNVTAVNHQRAGFTSAQPCGLPGATSSTLNQRPGAVTANGAIVLLAADTSSCVWSHSGGDVVVDLLGWWTAD